jgi:hypothetical protein
LRIDKFYKGHDYSPSPEVNFAFLLSHVRLGLTIQHLSSHGRRFWGHKQSKITASSEDDRENHGFKPTQSVTTAMVVCNEAALQKYAPDI